VIHQRRALAQQALNKAIQIRREVGLDQKSPICVYELCDKLGFKVQFVDFSMEGLYAKVQRPIILLSSLRPLPRRVFNCAHEVGHHAFGHGFRVDELCERLASDRPKSKGFAPEEFLADCFAGFLLMPALGVRQAVASRGWDLSSITPLQLYTVACNFGVGYETLIVHLKACKIISRQQADTLDKFTPKSIREELLGYSTPDPLTIADEHWGLPTIDAEVGQLLLLPHGTEVESNVLIFEETHSAGWLFRAGRPGIARAHCEKFNWAKFVRVSRREYCGLSRYRHLEQTEDEIENE
jgi:Zn-dependent peptidase ImmA (M78 family)